MARKSENSTRGQAVLAGGGVAGRKRRKRRQRLALKSSNAASSCAGWQRYGSIAWLAQVIHNSINSKTARKQRRKRRKRKRRARARACSSLRHRIIADMKTKNGGSKPHGGVSIKMAASTVISPWRRVARRSA
jgi:hypothetical protein